ncbi:T9SS type B sorting domain-containing protein [uncultured Nonlabens sp.]|uniref:T9SS type B sorting domain-containing protein n=1 Tax=uncultured Nonlabens sp. TaxID=859306 RepID=UPI00262F3503|nr:T9SS type B sorting domain-containing protein [uncultured Nonlabens sp.]
MKIFYLLFIICLYGSHINAQVITASSSSGEASIQKSTPEVASIQSGERFNYTIEFQNLNSNNTLVITDIIPAGLCFVASDVRANNAFIDQNGFPVNSPNTIPNLIDTSALPTVVFNIPNNIQRGSFTIAVSFCAGETPNGFSVTNNICADYTSNGNTENFCTSPGLTSIASAVNPWGAISKEAILPAVNDTAGNTFVQNTNSIANYRIIIQKGPAFQGISFGMLNLENVTISEIASPPCAVVSLISGPGTFNTITSQIELNNSLIGSDPFPFVEFIVEVDYSPCGMLAEGQSLSNTVELNGTPVGQTAQTNIASATSIVTATSALPAPEENSAIGKTVVAKNPVAGCQGRYDLFFFNADNRAIGNYEIIDVIPPGLIPVSYEVIGTISSFSPSGVFDVFINGTLDRSFTLPDDSGQRFNWNGASGDEIRIVAQNTTQIYPGDDVGIGIFFDVDASTSPGDLLTNCVDFTADIILDNAPNVPTGNQSCIDLLIEAPSMDVCIVKNVRIANTPDPFTTSITNVVPNDEVEFQICVQNNGSIDFNGRMEDVLDARYEFVSVDNTNMPTATTFNLNGQTLEWNNISIDQTCEVFTYDTGCAITDTFYCATVRVRIRPQTNAGNIDNSASIIENTGAILDTSDFAKVNVIDSSVLILKKEVSLDNITFQSTPLIVDPNCYDTIYYRLTVENIGNRDATQFQIFDELPAFGDRFFPTSLNRNSTFSFENIITTSNDFTISYLNYIPSNIFDSSNFNCPSTTTGNTGFTAGNSRTIRFENTRTLSNTDTFEIVIEARLPANGLTSFDIATNSAYAINCDLTSNLIASSSITSPAIIDIQKTVEAGPDLEITFCSDSNPFTLFNFFGGEADSGGSWSPPLTTAGVFDPMVDAAGVYTYTVTAVPSCATDTSEMTIIVEEQRDPGTDGNLTLCSTGAPVDLFNSINGTPDNGGLWSPSLNSNTGVFDPAIDPAGSYTYTLPATSACIEVSSMVNVTINTAVNAGDDNTEDLCSTGATVDLTTLLNGTPDAGGTWSPQLISGTSIFDPTMDVAGIYTYTVLGNTPCPDDSAQLTITITTSPDPGMDGSLEICANANAVDLFNSLTGTPETGGVWTPALTSTTGVFDPTMDAAGTYTYTLPALNSCPPTTAQVTVVKITEPDPGLDNTEDLCSTGATVDLTTLLNGTPDAGGTWSPPLVSGTSIFDPTMDPAGVYTYTVSGNAPCPDGSAQLTITITTSPDPGMDGSLEICANANAVDLFNSLTGTPETGGVWTPALTSTTGVFDPTMDAAGTYTYTLPALNACPPSTAQVAVDVTPAPDPGTDGSIVFCNTSIPVDLISALNGTPDTGGSWSPAFNSGTGIFDPAVDGPGMYTYTISRNGCMDESAVVAVNFNPNVVIAAPGNLEKCDLTGGNDGLTIFDLTQQENVILGGLDPLTHDLTYHLTSDDAINGVPGIATNYQNTAINETIYVRVENNVTNCFATTSFEITGLLLPEPMLEDEYEACFNENGVPIDPSRLPLLDTQLSTSEYTFRWFFAGNEVMGSTDGSFRVNAIGDYEVEVTNRTTGCVNIDRTTVVQEPYLMAEAVLSTTQFDNSPVITVNVTNDRGDMYWYRLDNGPWQRSNIFENVDDGIHIVSVKGPNSCGIATDEVLVLRYPRFFTPNNDGFNDYWQVENLTDNGNKLYIFDRYGKLLKQLSLVSLGWDGTYNGAPMPSSDYWFSLEYTDPNTGQMSILKSHFSLKR